MANTDPALESLCPQRRVVLLSIMAVVLLLLSSGCAATVERNAVPSRLVEIATPSGFESIRFWGDEAPQDAGAALKRAFPNLTRLAVSRSDAGRPLVNYLAISSGGGDGAFAAGLVVGWTRSGQRPRFDVVTGVSAGALIAPFVFLGPSHDRQLTEIWTHYGTDDLITKQPLAGLLGGSALADSEPLARLIARYVDRRLLDAIAEEFRRGRLLFVATTNLDAERPVVWNMGQIAASRNPSALTLFRQVLLASASVPGAMPPVLITVNADGKVREEMHVDGGTTRKVFLTPFQFSLRSLAAYYPAGTQHRVYVIANTKLAPSREPIQASVLAISGRSLSTMGKNQLNGDLLRMYSWARREGVEFKLASVPDDFKHQSTDLFDKAYMAALFNTARDSAARGYRWRDAPPEIADGPAARSSAN